MTMRSPSAKKKIPSEDNRLRTKPNQWVTRNVIAVVRLGTCNDESNQILVQEQSAGLMKSLEWVENIETAAVMHSI